MRQRLKSYCTTLTMFYLPATCRQGNKSTMVEVLMGHTSNPRPDPKLLNFGDLTGTGVSMWLGPCPPSRQDDYQHMVQDLINSQTDPSVAQRLARAFNDLTTGLVLNTERQNRLRFKDNFEKFITNVHGFLLVK